MAQPTGVGSCPALSASCAFTALPVSPNPGHPTPGPRPRRPSPRLRRPRRKHGLPGSLPKSSHLPSSTGKTVSRGATWGWRGWVSSRAALRQVLPSRLAFTALRDGARLGTCPPLGHVTERVRLQHLSRLCVPACTCVSTLHSHALRGGEHLRALLVRVASLPALPPGVILELSVTMLAFCNCSMQRGSYQPCGNCS